MEKTVKYVSIAVAFVRRDSELLFLQRRDRNPMWDKKWEFPGGKIDPGEEPIDAVKRETLEETGISISDVQFLGRHEHDWHLPDSILHVTLHCFTGRSDQAAVAIEPEKAYGFAWMTPKNALALDLLEANADLIHLFYPDETSDVARNQ